MLERREVSGFNAVRMHGVGELVITQGEREALTIESDDHILPLIESTVAGGTLSLGPKRGKRIRNLTQLVYTLTVTDLAAVTLDGDGITTIKDLSVDALTVNFRGAGDFTISGEARSQTVNIQGAGSYKGREFATAQATVRIQGSGEVVVRVSDSLNINISGVGDVVYFGDPTLTRKITGVGRVRQGR